jgi:hypothetical protein
MKRNTINMLMRSSHQVLELHYFPPPPKNTTNKGGKVVQGRRIQKLNEMKPRQRKGYQERTASYLISFVFFLFISGAQDTMKTKT